MSDQQLAHRGPRTVVPAQRTKRPPSITRARTALTPRHASAENLDDQIGRSMRADPYPPPSRSTNFWTLPVLVFGSSPNSIAFGP